MIRSLFLDVGGVLGTNGWDRYMRRAAAEKYSIDHADLDLRHKQTFGTYEEGKITLDEYLNRTIFYKPRPFSIEEFREHMFAESQPWPDMIALIRELKIRNDLQVVITSNEGRELAEHRIRYFGLDGLADIYIFSSFIGLRKPDLAFYRVALDVSQSNADEVLYFDDRDLFVEVATRGFGVQGICHKSIESTREQTRALGLS
jgi:putative hydrolase of the HAD superfamily